MSADTRLPRLTLEFFRGRGFLSVESFAAAPGVEVLDLRVEVPGITFPFSLSQAGDAFANVRTIARECELRIDPVLATSAVVAAVANILGRAVEAVWVGTRLQLDVIDLIGTVGPTALGFEPEPDVRGGVRVRAEAPRDPAGAALADRVEAALVQALNADALLPWLATAQGGTLKVDAVRHALARPFLARGYKLPDTRQLVCTSVQAANGRLRLRFGDQAAVAQPALAEHSVTAPAPSDWAVQAARWARGHDLPLAMPARPAELRAVARGAALVGRTDIRARALRTLAAASDHQADALALELAAVEAAVRSDRQALEGVATAALEALATTPGRQDRAHLVAAALESALLSARRHELSAARQRLETLLGAAGTDTGLLVDLLVRCSVLEDLEPAIAAFGELATSADVDGARLQSVAVATSAAWVDQGRSAPAIRLLDRALLHGPVDSALVAALERAWLADRDESGLAERLATLARTARTDAERVAFGVALSDAHARLGRREEAARVLRQALTISPGDRAALLRALDRLDDDESALAARALADAERDPAVRAGLMVELAARALADDHVDEALRWYRLAADASPSDEIRLSIQLCGARLAAAERQPPAPPARSTIGRNLERTRALLERAQSIVEAPAVENPPTHPTALVTRALAATSQKKRLAALSQLAANGAPHDRASALVALSLDPSQDPESNEALELVGRAWAIAPEMVAAVDDAVSLLEDLARERDDHALLVDLYGRRRRGATLPADRARLLLVEAGELRELGRIPEALSLLESDDAQAAEGDGTIDRLRAQLLGAAGRHADALDAWERAISQLPPDGWEHVEALRGAAADALKAGRDDAEERFSAAIVEAVPGDRHATDRYRRLVLRRGDHVALVRLELRALGAELGRSTPFAASSEVRDDLIEGREPPVEAAATLARLAQAVAGAGDQAEGRRLATLATRWRPDLPETFEARAAIERSGGDREGLVTALEALLPHLLRVDERRAVIDEISALRSAPRVAAAPTQTAATSNAGDELDRLAASTGVAAALAVLDLRLASTREPAVRAALLLRKGRWMLETGRPAREAVLVLKGALILDGGAVESRAELLVALVAASELNGAAEQARALTDSVRTEQIDSVRLTQALNDWAANEDGARHAEVREKLSKWLRSAPKR